MRRSLGFLGQERLLNVVFSLDAVDLCALGVADSQRFLHPADLSEDLLLHIVLVFVASEVDLRLVEGGSLLRHKGPAILHVSGQNRLKGLSHDLSVCSVEAHLLLAEIFVFSLVRG